MTDEQIEKVAREIITIGVEACGVPRDFDPSQLENGIDALLGADDAESWRGIARWHIQQVEAAVRKEREAILAMLGQSRRLAEKATMQMPEASVDWRSQARTIEACENAIRQRGGEGA